MIFELQGYRQLTFAHNFPLRFSHLVSTRTVGGNKRTKRKKSQEDSR